MLNIFRKNTVYSNLKPGDIVYFSDMHYPELHPAGSVVELLANGMVRLDSGCNDSYRGLARYSERHSSVLTTLPIKAKNHFKNQKHSSKAVDF
ncbi:MAG: hypothetical protein HY364_04870 [Candidatus Aenigmarchaeota archaeon]|nr:hypothetical protein [Candidatus Aenigmarchaeota archaeon]